MTSLDAVEWIRADARGDELRDAVEAAGSAPQTRVVGLRGDLDQLHRTLDEATLTALWRLPKPTVILLTGRVAGAGVDLACAADIRIAADTTRIADGRVPAGRAVSLGTSYRLPRLLGLSRATRLLLLGDEIGAAEAHRIGLVHHVVQADRFDALVAATLADLITLPADSYAVMKRQLLEQLDLGYEQALAHSLELRRTIALEGR